MQNKYFFHKFKYCPVCGIRYSKEDFNQKDTVFNCHNCGFQFYQNKSPTVAAIIPYYKDNFKILFTTRNINPGKGKIDLPGGFMQFEENAEDACIREIKEELGFRIKIDRLFSTQLTKYVFRGDLYLHTTIYFLTTPVRDLPKIRDRNENSKVEFISIADLESVKDKLAFESDYTALIKLRALFS